MSLRAIKRLFKVKHCNYKNCKWAKSCELFMRGFKGLWRRLSLSLLVFLSRCLLVLLHSLTVSLNNSCTFYPWIFEGFIRRLPPSSDPFTLIVLSDEMGSECAIVTIIVSVITSDVFIWWESHHMTDIQQKAFLRRDNFWDLFVEENVSYLHISIAILIECETIFAYMNDSSNNLELDNFILRNLFRNLHKFT